jgi:hypothetical protein
MDSVQSKRQDKRDSKKKQSAHSVYSAKHTRISEAVKKSSNQSTKK